MSEDRWVRIVDPQHVLRVGIDEEWHPAYGTYGWKSEIIIDGTTVGACAAYKFRCRLRDVPPGTKIVDPGPDHELVDPWDVDPDGYEDFFDTTDNTWNARVRPVSILSHHTIYRRRIRKPWPDQFAAATAAFRKAMEVSKTPQPGEWWFEDDGSDRVFIHGMNVKGQAICEWKFGGVSADDDWQGWHHEPACTGWDWIPPQQQAKQERLTLEQRVELLERRWEEIAEQVRQCPSGALRLSGDDA